MNITITEGEIHTHEQDCFHAGQGTCSSNCVFGRETVQPDTTNSDTNFRNSQRNKQILWIKPVDSWEDTEQLWTE